MKGELEKGNEKPKNEITPVFCYEDIYKIVLPVISMLLMSYGIGYCISWVLAAGMGPIDKDAVHRGALMIAGLIFGFMAMGYDSDCVWPE